MIKIFTKHISYLDCLKFKNHKAANIVAFRSLHNILYINTIQKAVIIQAAVSDPACAFSILIALRLASRCSPISG